MQMVQKKFANSPNFRSISITVDPERDGPDAMKDYSKKFDADLSKWFFLTGPKESIKNIMVKGFKIGFEDKPMFHSEKFVLVDKDLKIRGYYSYKDPEKFKALYRDIAGLLKKN